MTAECIAPARQWLELNTNLNASQRRAMAALAPVLLAQMDDDEAAIIGLAGPPGSGKSTLAGMLAAVATGMGRDTMLLSLDDYYLSQAQRRHLAEHVHPLLAQRGVPGTHDLQRLVADLARLRGERYTPIELPRFDKALDERSVQARLVAPGPALNVILEGWLVGLPPQNAAQLSVPCNELERCHDAEGHWRGQVNNALARYEQELWCQLGRRWALLAPDWERIVDWRWQQEQMIEPAHRHLPDRTAVAKFLAHFERLVRHQQASAAAWAGLILYLDEQHQITLEPPA